MSVNKNPLWPLNITFAQSEFLFQLHVIHTVIILFAVNCSWLASTNRGPIDNNTNLNFKKKSCLSKLCDITYFVEIDGGGQNNDPMMKFIER